MASKLFEAFNNTQGKSGKFGYTLTSSVNVMNALMAAKQKIEEAQGGGGDNFFDVGGEEEWEGGLLSNTLSGYYDSDGFVENGYSAQVNVKNYGAFVISKDTDDGEKSAVVAVEIGNDQIQNGIDSTGNKRFLANVNNDFNSYNGLKKFVYGFAIDVAQFGVPFFYKYYPSLDLNYTQICKLIENNCLCATIKFNNTEITALVTLDYYRGTGAHRDVFVPNFLLMQDNSKVGVYVSVDDATPVAVGSGDVQNPFSLLIYDNDTGEVSFGPEDVSSLVQNSTLAVKYSGCNLTNTKGDMRLFLNYNKKSKAEEIIGVPISQEVADRLFNLVDDEIEQGQSIVSGDGTGTYIILDVGHVPNAGADDWYRVTQRRCRLANKPYPYDYKGQNEYDYNKKMANAVAEKLRTVGCMVKVMDYTGISNNADINRVRNETESQDYSAFVSFHCQSYGSSVNDVTLNETSIGGSFAMIHNNSNVRHPRSKELAETIARRMTATWGKGKNTANDSRGLGVLRGKRGPKCLLEFSYINHKRDVDMLRDATFHDKLATEIANGILEFCNKQA